MNDKEILALVIEALDEVAPGKSEQIGEAGLTTKIRDLEIDSVATMEMIGFIEEQLDVVFPDEALAQVSHLEDLANLIRSAA